MTEAVLSVSTSQTFHLIVKYGVYACPNHYTYRKTRFITFRQARGAMAVVYDLSRATIFVMKPESDQVRQHFLLRENGIIGAVIERVDGYIKQRLGEAGFSKFEQRFYVLPEEGNIQLSHAPIPQRNYPGQAYYTLGELLSGKKIVTTMDRVSS